MFTFTSFPAKNDTERGMGPSNGPPKSNGIHDFYLGTT